MTASVLYIDADIDNNDSFSLSLLDYMVAEFSDVNIQRGIDENREYQSSEVTFKLTNRSSIFTLNNYSSSIWGRWGIGVKIRVNATKDAVVFNLWTGYITNLDYEYDFQIKQYVCSVTCNDLSYILDKYTEIKVPFAQNITTSEAIRRIAILIPDIYNFGTSFVSKATDPAALPASTGNAVAFHPSGKYVAIAHFTSPFVSVYPWNGTTIGAKLGNPSPALAGQGNGVAFSSDGTILGISHSNTPYFSLYAFDAVSGAIGTRFTDPTTTPTGKGLGISFSHDSKLVAISHEVSPYISVYPISVNTTAFPVTVTATNGNWSSPDNIKTDNGLDASQTFSSSNFPLICRNYSFSVPSTATISGIEIEIQAGNTWGCRVAGLQLYYGGVVVGVKKEPNAFLSANQTVVFGGPTDKWGYASTYSIVNDVGFGFSLQASGMLIDIDYVKMTVYYEDNNIKAIGLKRANPTTIPTGDGKSVSFSPSGNYLAVGHNTSPYLSVYNWNKNVFGTKITNPVTALGSAALGVAWSQREDYIGVSLLSSPYITIYNWTGTAFGTKLADPSTLPPGQGNSISFSLDNKQVAIGTVANTSVLMYYYNNKEIGQKITNGLTYSSSDTNGITFDTSTGALAIASSGSPYLLVYKGNSLLSLESGDQIIPYFVDPDAGSVWEIIKKIAYHELNGFLYISGSGQLTFKKRSSNLYSTPTYSVGPDYANDTSPYEAEYELRAEDRKTRYKLNTKSYVIGQDGLLVYVETKGSAKSDSIEIAPYGVYETTIKYNINQVYKTEPLLVDVDYTFASTINGTNNQNNAAIIDFYDLGTEGNLYIFNNSAAIIYMTKFQIRGTPLSLPLNDKFTEYNEPLIVNTTTIWGTGQTEEELLYLPDSKVVTGFSIGNFKTSRYTNPKLNLSYNWNSSISTENTKNSFLVQTELFQTFRYADKTTSDGMNIDYPLRIVGINHQLNIGELIQTTLTTLPFWTNRNVDKVAWDYFKRGNSSSLGNSPSGHVWSSGLSILSNKAQGSAGIFTIEIATLELTTAKQVVEVIAGEIVGSGGTAKGGVVFRYQDSSNYWALYVGDIIGTTFVYLDKVIAGATTHVATLTPYTLGSGVNGLRVMCYDNYIKAYVGYRELYSGTDSFLNTATKVGLLSQNSASSGGTQNDFTNFYAQGL